MLHDSKKHASNTLCAAYKLVIMCAANCHSLPEENQCIQLNGMLAKHDKIRGHKEIK